MPLHNLFEFTFVLGKGLIQLQFVFLKAQFLLGKNFQKKALYLKDGLVVQLRCNLRIFKGRELGVDPELSWSPCELRFLIEDS